MGPVRLLPSGRSPEVVRTLGAWTDTRCRSLSVGNNPTSTFPGKKTGPTPAQRRSPETGAATFGSSLATTATAAIFRGRTPDDVLERDDLDPGLPGRAWPSIDATGRVRET